MTPTAGESQTYFGDSGSSNPWGGATPSYHPLIDGFSMILPYKPSILWGDSHGKPKTTRNIDRMFPDAGAVVFRSTGTTRAAEG